MKKLATLALLLSLGTFAVGCAKTEEPAATGGEAAPATTEAAPATTEAAPAEGAAQ